MDVVPYKLKNIISHGCGTVGRAVAFDIRDPWFESQHLQSFSNLTMHNCQLQFRKRRKEKEKEAGIGPFKETTKKLMNAHANQQKS